MTKTQTGPSEMPTAREVDERLMRRILDIEQKLVNHQKTIAGVLDALKKLTSFSQQTSNLFFESLEFLNKHGYKNP